MPYCYLPARNFLYFYLLYAAARLRIPMAMEEPLDPSLQPRNGLMIGVYEAVHNSQLPSNRQVIVDFSLMVARLDNRHQLENAFHQILDYILPHRPQAPGNNPQYTTPEGILTSILALETVVMRAIQLPYPELIPSLITELASRYTLESNNPVLKDFPMQLLVRINYHPIHFETQLFIQQLMQAAATITAIAIALRTFLH